MIPSSSVVTQQEAARVDMNRLQKSIEQEVSECESAIGHQRQQIDEYRALRLRLEEISHKIEHNIMVPFGSVGFMPGRLVRTNEVMVLLGENYFVERSTHQTSQIIARRITHIEKIITGLETQKEGALKRLEFARSLFGGKSDEVEIREEYDEEKEAELRKKRKERKTDTVNKDDFKDLMAHLDKLEAEEDGTESGEVSAGVPPGVDPQEYARLLKQIEAMEEEDEEEEEGEEGTDDEELNSQPDSEDEPKEEMDSDDVSESSSQIGEESSQDGRANHRLTHKRSVRFKKNLEAGPSGNSLSLSLDEANDFPLPSRSILRNKSEESPIDQSAVAEMEREKFGPAIVPAGTAFNGMVVERNLEVITASDVADLYKPADEPPKRISRFKLQRMQKAE